MRLGWLWRGPYLSHAHPWQKSTDVFQCQMDWTCPVSAVSDSQIDETPTSSSPKRHRTSISLEDMGDDDLDINLSETTPISNHIPPTSTSSTSTATSITSASTPAAVFSMAPPLRPVTRQLAKKIPDETQIFKKPHATYFLCWHYFPLLVHPNPLNLGTTKKQ